MKNNVILLSYPISGNTFLRYSLEYLTQSPTLDGKNRNPLCSFTDKLKCTKEPFIYKRHFIHPHDTFDKKK